MSFHEVQFPTDVSYGSRGGPGFSTSIVMLDSGAEHRASRWESARHQYDVSYGVKSQSQLAAVKTFYMARMGAAHGFRFKDWCDFTTASDGISAHAYDDVEIGTGDGTETEFQLVKKYTSGSTTHTRVLTKPVSGTVKVALDDVEATSGWSVDTTTGFITFTSAPSAAVSITAGCEFDVPVRFTSEADESLAASASFFEGGDIDSIPLVEIIEDAANADIDYAYWYGGSYEACLQASVLLNPLVARVWVFEPSASGYQVKLPQASEYPDGGPMFYIINVDDTYSFNLADYLGNSFFTVLPGEGVVCVISKNDSGAATWYVK